MRKIGSKLKNATFLVVIHGAEAKPVEQITEQGDTKRMKLVFNRDYQVRLYSDLADPF